MFYSYEVSKDASDFLSEWGDEKQQYIDAILRGLIPTFMGIGHQLQLVCHRERIQPEVGFVFGIGLKYTQVEVFLRVAKIPCFMTLMPDVNEQAYLILSLKTKAEMEDERAWEAEVEKEAELASMQLASDCAREGVTKTIKQNITKITSFARLLESSRTLEWQRC